MNSKAAAKISNLLQIAVVKICQEVIDFADELIVQGVISVEADGHDVCTVSFKESADKLGASTSSSERPGAKLEQWQNKEWDKEEQDSKKDEPEENIENKQGTKEENTKEECEKVERMIEKNGQNRVHVNDDGIEKDNRKDQNNHPREDMGEGLTGKESNAEGDVVTHEHAPIAENVLVDSLVAQALKLWYDDDNSGDTVEVTENEKDLGQRGKVHQEDTPSLNDGKISNETLGRSGYDSLKTVGISLSSCHLGVPKSMDSHLVDGKDAKQISPKKLNEDPFEIQRRSPLKRQQAEPSGAGPIPESIYSQQASGSAPMPSPSPQLLISNVPESAKHHSATILPHQPIAPSALASQSCQINGYFNSNPAVAKTPPISRSSSVISLPPTDTNNRPSSSQLSLQKLHRCNICMKDFTFSTNRTRHQRNIHGRPYCRKGKDTESEEKANLSAALYFKPNSYRTTCEHMPGIVKRELADTFSPSSQNYPSKDDVSRSLNFGMFSSQQGSLLIPKYMSQENSKPSVIKHTLSLQEPGVTLGPLPLQKRSFSLPSTRPEEGLPRTSLLPRSLGEWHSKDFLNGPTQKFLKCHFCNLSFTDFQRLTLHINAVHRGNAESVPLFLQKHPGHSSKISDCEDGPIDMRTTPPIGKPNQSDVGDSQSSRSPQNIKLRRMSAVGQYDAQGLCQLSLPEDLSISEGNTDLDGNSGTREGGSPRGRYPCGSCGHVFTLPSNLRRHVRNMHPSDSASNHAAHICDLCGAAYPVPLELHNHLRLTHQVVRDISREDQTDNAVPENLTTKADKPLVLDHSGKIPILPRREVDCPKFAGQVEHRSQDIYRKPSGTKPAEVKGNMRESIDCDIFKGHNVEVKGNETGSRSSGELGKDPGCMKGIDQTRKSSNNTPEYSSIQDLSWGLNVKREYGETSALRKQPEEPETNDGFNNPDQELALTRRSSDEENIPQGEFPCSGNYFARGKFLGHENKGFIGGLTNITANCGEESLYEPKSMNRAIAPGVDLHKVIENVVQRSLLDEKDRTLSGCCKDMNENSAISYVLEKDPLSQSSDTGNLQVDGCDRTTIQSRYPHLKELIISKGKSSSGPNSPTRPSSPLNLMTKPKYKGKFRKYFAMEENKNINIQSLPLNSAKENGLPEEPYIGEELNLKISVQREESNGKLPDNVDTSRVPTPAEKKLYSGGWEGKACNQVLSESFPAISDGKRFVCGLCGNSFTFQTNLTRHQRRTHGKPYVRKPAVDRKLLPGAKVNVGVKSKAMNRELGIKHEHMVEQPAGQ